MASLVDTFVQVNFVRGWRYLDDAGKIMNRYDDEFPAKEVGVQGLKLQEGKPPLIELTVAPDRLWLHFDRPGTITLAGDQSLPYIADISDILSVTNSSRFGLRSQWVLPTDSIEAGAATVRAAAFANQLVEALPGEATDGSVELKWKLPEGILTTLRLSVGERGKKPSAKDLPAYVIVIDLDVSQKSDEGKLTIAQFRPFTKVAERWTRIAIDSIGKVIEKA